MLIVLAMAAGLWVLGRVMGTPVAARLITIGLLYLAVMAALVVLPAGHPLANALGGTLQEWALLGVLGVAIWAYSQGLGWLRARVRPENQPKAAAASDDARRNRAMRHIILREIGGMGQKRIEEARVLVVGAGGLGAPVLQYLAAAGVGTLGVIDDDVVELTNLQRQTIHTDARVGMPKVFSVGAALAPQNPFVTLKPYNRRLTEDIAADLFADYDLVVDGTDDVATRYVVNAAAVAAGIPLVSGAISQWEGQVSVFDTARGAPCYACLFPVAAAPGLSATCAEAGVASPLPGVIGTLMALEVIKVLTDAGDPLRGRMLIYDGLHANTRILKVERDPNCSVCRRGPV